MHNAHDKHIWFIKERGINLTPREMFDRDLMIELTSWIDQHIRIIVCLDSNENVSDGPLFEMVIRLGLRNAHTACYNTPLPATHDRGKLLISAIFISPTIHSLKAGILEHGVGIEDDYRSMFIDVDENECFGDDLYVIPPPSQRRLQLFDSRVVKRFIQKCLRHLNNNNILNKSITLLNTRTTTPPSIISHKLQKLDDQIGRTISVGEKRYRKMKSGDIPYSEEFRILNNTKRF